DPLAARNGCLPEGRLAPRMPARLCHAVNNTRTPPSQAGRRGSPPLANATLQAATFSLGQPAPDPKSFVVFKRVLQAFRSHLTAPAHLLGLSGGAALLGEERLGIGLRAQRPVLPGEPPSVVHADSKDVRPERDDLCHGAPPALIGSVCHSPWAHELHK